MAENAESSTSRRGQTRKDESPMLAELVTIEEELRDYMRGLRETKNLAQLMTTTGYTNAVERYAHVAMAMSMIARS